MPVRVLRKMPVNTHNAIRDFLTYSSRSTIAREVLPFSTVDKNQMNGASIVESMSTTWELKGNLHFLLLWPQTGE